MSTKKLNWGIFLSSMSLLMASCGPGQDLGPAFTPTPAPTSTPAATPTPTPFVKEGTWETVGDSGSPVSFEVTAEGMVRNFKILINGDCDVQVNKDFPIDADHKLVIGEVDAEGNPVNTGITGFFDSATTVTGSFANPWRCGTSSAYTEMYLPSQLASWTAEWRGP